MPKVHNCKVRLVGYRSDLDGSPVLVFEVEVLKGDVV